MQRIAKIWMTMGAIGAVFLAGCASLNPATAGQIQSSLDAKKQAFQSCYEDALKRNRNLQGTITLKVEFEPKKTAPSAISVKKSTISDKQMEQCVIKHARTISVQDQPGAYVDGYYTVVFQAK